MGSTHKSSSVSSYKELRLYAGCNVLQNPGLQDVIILTIMCRGAEVGGALMCGDKTYTLVAPSWVESHEDL